MLTVIVEVAFEPASTPGGLVELIAKSGGVPKVNEIVVECVKEPLVAVIATVYTFCVAELQDRVTFPFAVTLLGVTGPHVNSLGTVSVKPTVPENPFNPVTVMFEFAEEPKVTGRGLEAVRVKSLNLKTADVEWVRGPLVPVIVRA